MRCALVSGLWWLPFLATGESGAQEQPRIPMRVVNGSFEEAAVSAVFPAGWYAGGAGYRVQLDRESAYSGTSSLRSERIGTEPFTRNTSRFGIGSQVAIPSHALGRSVRLSGWIRTASVDSGYAGLWMRVDGQGGYYALDNMEQRGITGTTPWTRHVIELAVDSAATSIVFGVLHPGTGTAWFDSLTLEAFGTPQPRSRLTPMIAPRRTVTAIPPQPTEDMTRLLSDAELAVVDSGAPPGVDSATAAWVRTNAHPIRSLGASDFSDLAFLRPLLQGKRIVQLGESGHGVREFNLAKVRLIKYLHEVLGYDVLAFESSLYACHRTGGFLTRLTAEEAMRGCIFPVWYTEELVSLFEYVRATQSTPRPLRLAGFDIQPSSASDASRSGFLRKVIAVLDSGYAARVHLTDSVFARSPSVMQHAQRERESLLPFYDSLATWLKRNEDALVRRFADDPIAPVLARQAALSMSLYVRQVSAPGAEASATRDRGMADNLDVVLDVLHRGRKVIVWAHNGHIQHLGYGPGATPRATSFRSMGSWVAERRRAELYTIGLYMYRGFAASNVRVVYPVSPVDAGSLEAILHRAPWKYSFVDLSRAPKAPGTAWMWQTLRVKEWGTQPTAFIPRDEYDGLLFIDRTWPPAYLGRP
jgi:erythromycin esterase